MGLKDQFTDNSTKGFSNFYKGSLKAQDNPDFMAAYKDLLKKNDRVLYLDNHLQTDGREMAASPAHMRMLKEAGYKFHLIEYDPSLNPIIEFYERGNASISEVEEAIYAFQKNDAFKEDPNLKTDLETGKIPYEDFTRAIKDYLKPIVTTIQNAKDQGIKVRFFDDATIIGKDLEENDENSHINNPIFRRDDSWDPYIEALTKGEKAFIFIGAGHAASSYGIDEYMEARGYKVGTVTISSEIAAKGKSITPENNFLISHFESVLKADPDGYDRLDFVVDLFYHDTTRTIKQQKILEAERQMKMAPEPAAPIQAETLKEVSPIEIKEPQPIQINFGA